ncbi:DUF58 domain-containing protein [Paenibacillus protaetiae]|uniref:DUF58 domain-containing protein n=1 Tax=Paenibacillus protaetiae TaxID=2509456 RepID=A0A4P6EV25_9BACL|nr:DUF58 domain-containing protein [Paenibacillus protaetiae]QAY66003.1 DUF58 domain-containing protein [Paenibacillus protaetiae]
MIVFWFAAAALVIIFIQGWLFNRFGLVKVSYTRQFQKHTCFKGDQLELVERLTNAKWLPLPWLRVESQLPAALAFQHQDNFVVSSGDHYQNHKSFFALMPYTRITRKHRIRCTKRGYYRLESVTLTGGDLFGMKMTSKRIQLSDELVVYPTPAQVPVSELPSHSWQGEISVRRWIVEDPFVIAGARAYRSGDTPKQVNWKATARTGTLQSHQYDFTADRKLMIYLNVEDHEEMWRDVKNFDLIEQGIEWAAGAAEAVCAQGMEVGFAANMPFAGDEAVADSSVLIEPRSGGGQLLALLDAMAKLELERTEQMSDMLAREADRGYSGRDVLIISSYWNDRLELEAQRIRRTGNAVAVWLLEQDGQAADSEDAACGHKGGASA